MVTNDSAYLMQRQDILVKNYPSKIGLTTYLDNNDLVALTGDVNFVSDRKVSIMDASSIRTNIPLCTIKDNDGNIIANEINLYRSIPYSGSSILSPSENKFLYKYLVSEMLYKVIDSNGNTRYASIPFETAKVFSDGEDITDKIEPIIYFKENLSGFSVVVDDIIDDETVTTNDLSKFLAVVSIELPLKKSSISSQLFYEQSDYNDVSIIESSPMRVVGNRLVLENSYRFIANFSNSIILEYASDGLSFYIYSVVYNNIWDNPLEFGQISLLKPTTIEETKSAMFKSRQLPADFESSGITLLSAIWIDIYTSGDNTLVNSTSYDYFPEYVNDFPELIEARTVYEHKQLPASEVVKVAKEEYLTIGDRLDDLNADIESLQFETGTKLPNSVTEVFNELSSSLAEVKTSLQSNIDNIMSEINVFTSSKNIVSSLGQILSRPTELLYKAIAPTILEKTPVKIIYATLEDRLKDMDKDIYRNLYKFIELDSRILQLEDVFKVITIDIPIDIDVTDKENKYIDIEREVSELSGISLKPSKSLSTNIFDIDSFDFKDLIWINNILLNAKQVGNNYQLVLPEKIYYKYLPLGLDMTYDISEVPVMFYDSAQLKAYNAYINKEYISSTSKLFDTKDYIAYESDSITKVDQYDYDDVYNGKQFCAGSINIDEGFMYFDINSEKEKLQNNTNIDFYKTYDRVYAEGLHNGIYVSYNEYITLLANENSILEYIANNDYIYTFEITEKQNKQYSITVLFISKKIDGVYPEYINVKFSNIKKYGYFESYQSVDSILSQLKSASSVSVVLNNIIDKQTGNVLNAKSFYVLRKVKYIAHKLSYFDNRKIFSIDNDFLVTIYKDSLKIPMILEQTFSYSTVTNIRVSYAYKKRFTSVFINSETLLMPHRDVYIENAILDSFGSWYDIGKRLWIYSNSMDGTTDVERDFYTTLAASQNSTYRIFAKAIVKKGAISILQNDFNDFKSYSNNMNTKIFGTLLFTSDANIVFDTWLSDLGNAVFGLKIQDGNIVSNPSEVFHNGKLYTLGSISMNPDVQYGSDKTYYVYLTILNDASGLASITLSETELIDDMSHKVLEVSYHSEEDITKRKLKVIPNTINYSPFDSFKEIILKQFNIENSISDFNKLNSLIAGNPYIDQNIDVVKTSRSNIIFNDSNLINTKYYFNDITDINKYNDGDTNIFSIDGKELLSKQVFGDVMAKEISYTPSLKKLIVDALIDNIDITIDNMPQLRMYDDLYGANSRYNGLQSSNRLSIADLKQAYSFGNVTTTIDLDKNFLLKKTFRENQYDSSFYIKNIELPIDSTYNIDAIKYETYNMYSEEFLSESIMTNMTKYSTLDTVAYSFSAGDSEVSYDSIDRKITLLYGNTFNNIEKVKFYKIRPEMVKEIVVTLTGSSDKYVIYKKDDDSLNSSVITESGYSLEISNVPLLKDGSLYTNIAYVDVIFDGIVSNNFSSIGSDVSLYLKTVTLDHSTNSSGDMLVSYTSVSNKTAERFWFQNGKEIFIYIDNSIVREYYSYSIYYEVAVDKIDINNVSMNVFGKPSVNIDTNSMSSTDENLNILLYVDEVNVQISDELFNGVTKYIFREKVVSVDNYMINQYDYYVYLPIAFVYLDKVANEYKIITTSNNKFDPLEIQNAKLSNTFLIRHNTLDSRFEWIEKFLKDKFYGHTNDEYTAVEGINDSTYENSQLLIDETVIHDVSGKSYLDSGAWKMLKSAYASFANSLTVGKNLNLNNNSYNDLPIVLSNIKIDNTDINKNNSNRVIEKRFAIASFYDDTIAIDEI